MPQNFTKFIFLLLVSGLLLPAPVLGDARNHLAGESSPYLGLHKADPVHWHAWSEATLAEAKESGRPILLSIGYSACHWCHVMQRESFSDGQSAAKINRDFFAILVDREERPDIDQIFQSAALVMKLSSGWPLNMFLTAGAKPFWGGAYFPKEPIGGVPAFTQVLARIADVYAKQRDGITDDAADIARAVAEMSAPRPGELSMGQVEQAAQFMLSGIDEFFGGFGEAPKFPDTEALRLLWRAYTRSGKPEYRDPVLLTLGRMAAGGLYDHVGGGFFRYAVDNQWLTPHFEKMLDVNAQLLRILTEAWRVTREPLFEVKIRETAAFLLRDMKLPGGAFAAALDADSPAANFADEEGAFYVWSRSGLKRVLGDRWATFAQAYDIAPIEGRNIDDDGDAGILYRAEDTVTEIAAASGLAQNTVRRRLSAALAKLRKVRAGRAPPFRDGKILADWNGLAITALTEAALALGEDGWLRDAGQALDFVAEKLTDSAGRLRHSWRNGVLGAMATLDDLAFLSEAAFTLLEATGEDRYRRRTIGWAETAIRYHWDKKQGGFYATAADAGAVLIRAKPVIDDPNAAGNGKISEILSRLYYLTGSKPWQEIAARNFTTFGGLAEQPSMGLAGFLNAYETHRNALQIAIIGRRGEKGTDALVNRVAGLSIPNRILQVVAPGTELPDSHPARYKTQVAGRATGYVCRGTVCSLPATDAQALGETIAAMQRRK